MSLPLVSGEGALLRPTPATSHVSARHSISGPSTITPSRSPRALAGDRRQHPPMQRRHHTRRPRRHRLSRLGMDAGRGDREESLRAQEHLAEGSRRSARPDPADRFHLPRWRRHRRDASDSPRRPGSPDPRPADPRLHALSRGDVDRPAVPHGCPGPRAPRLLQGERPHSGELFAKLDEWGVESIGIPHGTTWGNTSPPGFHLGLQIGPRTMTRSDRRSWRSTPATATPKSTATSSTWSSTQTERDLSPTLPGPSGYLPNCRRAGEIIGIAASRRARARTSVRHAPRSLARTTLPGARPASAQCQGRGCRGLARCRPVPRLLPPCLRLPAAHVGAIHARAKELRGRSPSRYADGLHRIERQSHGATGDRLQGKSIAAR